MTQQERTKSCGGYSEDAPIRSGDNGGSSRAYLADSSRRQRSRPSSASTAR